MKKLSSDRGESIAEALAAIAIITAVALFLARSMITAAGITAASGAEQTELRYSGSAGRGEITVSVGADSRRAVLWETEQGYYYYSGGDGG